jgi:hypothetical protein
MAHNDSDDKVHLAGEGLLADSQEPAAVEAANASLRDSCSELWRKSRTRDAAPNEEWRMRANTGFPTLRLSFCRS